MWRQSRFLLCVKGLSSLVLWPPWHRRLTDRWCLRSEGCWHVLPIQLLLMPLLLLLQLVPPLLLLQMSLLLLLLLLLLHGSGWRTW